MKSYRYSDGLYPSCKTCRTKLRKRLLSERPLCSRCKLEPHLLNHFYCLKCQRVSKGMTPVRTRRKALAPHLCPICNLRPKREYSGYCRVCSNQKQKEFIKSKGGAWAYATNRGQRHKMVARAYVNTLLQRNQLERKPCEVCGKLETEAHHNSYENPLDIRWLCKEHHDALERWIRAHRKKDVDGKPR